MADAPVSEHVSEYEKRRVYFVVPSKYDEATLAINHHSARQWLVLPVYPSSAVEEALPLLYGIAPIESAEQLLAIARKHVANAPEGEAWLADPSTRILWDNAPIWESNKKDFTHEAEIINEHGIDL